MMMAQALFEELAFRNVMTERLPYAVNIGCGDGRMYEDPVYPLYAAGFAGVAIDATVHDGLDQNLGDFNVVLRPGTAVYPHNIVSVLSEAGCPVAPSFLKIDIDGLDADILRAVLVEGIRPLVIQAEVNTEIPPPYAFSVCASDKFSPGSEHGFYGMSLSYADDLLAGFGYSFYKLDFETPWTHDALWVHNTVLTRSGLHGADLAEEFMRRPPCLYHIASTTKEAITSWWTRTDRDAVRAEIWTAMLGASRLKLGHDDVPFELYIRDR